MDLEAKAKEIRRIVLDMVYSAQSSHIGSNLSEIEILVWLYYEVMKPEDKFVLSKGWGVATLYAILYDKGILTKADIDSYCKDGSKYIGLAEPVIPEISFAGGSMGMGFPAAVGFALAKKIKREPGTVYCLMSDGEFAIGTTWEAMLIAAHHKLDNLVVIVDCNGFQAMGRTSEVLDTAPMIPKFLACDWDVMECEGNDFGSLRKAFSLGYRVVGLPFALVASTVKGKGVSFMENKLEWHYRNIGPVDYEIAKKELE